jgi:Toprim domain
MSRIRQAKGALLDRLEAVVRELAPGGRIRGRVYTGARNPGRADRHPGSFVVWMKGPAAGGWKDYASGETGDIIDLICLAKGLDPSAALSWAEAVCGLHGLSDAERQAIERRARQRQRQREGEAEHQEAVLLSRARRLFFNGAADGLNQPIVRAYLASRAIPVDELQNLDKSFRFYAGFEWWPGRDGDRRGPMFPALVSAMVDAVGALQAVHFTFLRPDGSGKADVERPKLMWPRTAGSVIRVARGAGNRRAETAAKLGQPDTVVLTEGIEDALSITLSAPELRIWAAGSLPGLLHVPNHGCVNGWLVARDRDWGKFEAAALFERAVYRLRKMHNLEVIEPVGKAKDFNDLLRGAA